MDYEKGKYEKRRGILREKKVTFKGGRGNLCSRREYIMADTGQRHKIAYFMFVDPHIDEGSI